MERPPSVSSDDTTGPDVTSLRTVLGKMIEEMSKMNREMEVLKCNVQGLKGRLKQLQNNKKFNKLKAASLKDRINLLSQHKQSLSLDLTKLRLKIKRDRDLESSMSENLRVLRLTDSEKMTKCNQDVEKCTETMAVYKELYAELPWVREKIQKSTEVHIGNVTSARCKQLVKEVVVENLLMARLDCQRQNAEIYNLSRLMVKWKAQLEKNGRSESSVRFARNEVLALKKRKKEISSSMVAETQRIIHGIVGRTGSEENLRGLQENSLQVKPTKAPSLRELLGIRKLQDVNKTSKPQRRIGNEDENVEQPSMGNDKEIHTPAEERPALDLPAEPAARSVMPMDNEALLPIQPDIIIPEKTSDVVDATLLPSRTDQLGPLIHLELLSDESEKGGSVSPSEPEATEQGRNESPTTQEQVPSLRATLKPPPTIGMKFSPSHELNQPVELTPLDTTLTSVVNPNGAPNRLVETENTESAKIAKTHTPPVAVKSPSPKLNVPIQIIDSPVRSKNDRQTPSTSAAGRRIETEPDVIEVIELSDSGDSNCSEVKIIKIGPISRNPAPKRQLPQPGYSQRKTKKVSFLGKSADPGQENVPKALPAKPVSPPESSQLTATTTEQEIPLKLNQQANIPVIPTPSPEKQPEASMASKVNNSVFDSCFGDIFGTGAPQTLPGPSGSPTNSGADFFCFGNANQPDSSDKPLSDFFSFF